MDPFIIGGDLGGTNVRAALIDRRGSVLDLTKLPTQASEGRAAIAANTEKAVELTLAAAARRGVAVAAIGIGTAGQIDVQAGVIRGATANLPGWAGMPLRDMLADRFGLPVWVENDGNAAAFGEAMLGAGQGSTEVVCLTLGTGVGGGIVTSGRLLRGRRGAAGELGHMSINFQGPPCNCGKSGCLETYLSGPAIARRAMAKLRDDPRGILAASERENGAGSVQAEEVFAAAGQGDPLAGEVLAETADLLGFALADLANIFSPQYIVIGGGVGEAIQPVLERARQVMERLALPATGADATVCPAMLGNGAGLIGAALLAGTEFGVWV